MVKTVIFRSDKFHRMKKMSKTSEFEIAPLRPLDDFLLEAARFQIPNFKDLEKWGNRVASNLLYYQTNYFLMSLVMFVIVGLFHPVKMVCGCLASAVIFMVFVYIANETPVSSVFKNKHPVISIILILSGIYLTAYFSQSLLVFLLGIMLPFSATFVHASLRLRNIKNKLTNKVEGLGLKRTPMGIFLEKLGLENEVF